MIPLLFSLSMNNYNSGIYDKLPARIPVHFGLNGYPDRWAKKSKLSVNLIPGLNFVIAAGMFGSFYYLPMKTAGGQVDFLLESTFYGGIISAATAWLLYNINRAMMDSALGGTESLWKYVKLPLAAVIVCSLLPVAYFLIPRHGELDRVAMCAGINKDYSTYDERTTFSVDDKSAYIWLRWRSLNGDHKVHYEWRAPDGDLYREFDYWTNKNRYRKLRVTYAYIDIAGNPPAGVPGTWSVDVYRDGEFVVEKKFDILELDK